MQDTIYIRDDSHWKPTLTGHISFSVEKARLAPFGCTSTRCVSWQMGCARWRRRWQGRLWGTEILAKLTIEGRVWQT
jgi:hypothetical protein